MIALELTVLSGYARFIFSMVIYQTTNIFGCDSLVWGWVWTPSVMCV